MDSRRVEFDLLRGIAAFGIVGCHLLLSPRTASASALTSFCDLNVGVFGALAGFMMFGRTSGGWLEYSWKRTRRILPVYVFWSLIFLCSSAMFQICLEGGINPRYGDPHWWPSVIFWGGASCHLWFLACLLYSQVIVRGLVCVFKGLAAHAICGICIVLGLGLILMSVTQDNWWGKYPIRLLAFVITGYGLGALHSDGLIQSNLLAFSLILGALFFHYFIWGSAPDFLNDWVTASGIVLGFAMLRVTGSFGRIAEVAGRTSMGVYLIHPLYTAVGGVLIRRLFAQPYGLLPILVDWVLAWLLAFLTGVLILRLSRLKRFVE